MWQIIVLKQKGVEVSRSIAHTRTILFETSVSHVQAEHTAERFETGGTYTTAETVFFPAFPLASFQHMKTALHEQSAFHSVIFIVRRRCFSIILNKSSEYFHSPLKKKKRFFVVVVARAAYKGALT